MGAVYLAQDTKLDRQVALKILLDEVATDKERLRRFTQEAKAASALNHPNILTVYEIGDINESRYIATELVRGATLREHLQSGRIPLREVLDVVIQVATALTAAHQAGIVHRDIKPENIMIRHDGIVKVLDFGLAKLVATPTNEVDSDEATHAQVKTLPGVIIGTVRYMSPEQARGKETDPRSDIWSLGAVTYEMLSGTAPFAGETPNDTIAAILTGRPASLDDAIPLELRRIVKKALQKQADERYQTIKDLLIDAKNLKRELEFSEELERSYLPHSTGSSNVSTGQRREAAPAIQPGGFSTKTSTAPRHISSAEIVTSAIRQHKFGATAVFAMAVVILAGFGYGLYRFIQSPQVEEPRAPGEFKIQRLTGDGKTPDAEVSPDGKFLAYLKLEGGEQSLWIKQVQTNSTVPIVEPGDLSRFWGITFSPDGGFVYFNAAGPHPGPATVYRVPSLGGTPTRVLTNAYLVQFSPAGDHVSFLRTDPATGATAVMIANADGSNVREIASKVGKQSFVGSPAWSPDAKHIAVGYVDNSLAPNPATSIKLISVADNTLSDLGSHRWSGPALMLSGILPGTR